MKTALRVAFWVCPITAAYSGFVRVVAPKWGTKHCGLYRFMWTGSTEKPN
jgi:hypothetical protein